MLSKNSKIAFCSLFTLNVFIFEKLCAAQKSTTPESSDNSIGIFVDPGINLTGANFENSVKKVEGSKDLSLSGGISYMIPFTNDKYAWNVNLGYIYDPISFIISNDDDAKNINEKHNLHYLIFSPIGIILRSDEIGATDLSIFFRASFSAKILLSHKLVSSENRTEPFLKEFNRFGLEANFSIGLEYMVGLETIIGLGAGFGHDFLNKISKHEDLEKEMKLNCESSRIIILNFYAYF